MPSSNTYWFDYFTLNLMMQFCFLPKVHSEHRKRMRDADMLENHIIQARVQATATESQVHDTVLEEMGVAYHHLGLPAGKLEAPIIEQYKTKLLPF